LAFATITGVTRTPRSFSRRQVRAADLPQPWKGLRGTGREHRGGQAPASVPPSTGRPVTRRSCGGRPGVSFRGGGAADSYVLPRVQRWASRDQAIPRSLLPLSRRPSVQPPVLGAAQREAAEAKLWAAAAALEEHAALARHLAHEAQATDSGEYRRAAERSADTAKSLLSQLDGRGRQSGCARPCQGGCYQRPAAAAVRLLAARTAVGYATRAGLR
jgi:hypothetical protein